VNSQRAYLLHTLDAIDAVIEYTQDGRDASFADRKTQDAVIRNIEVLGQAVKASQPQPGHTMTRSLGARSPDTRQAHPRILRR
jgi:hypothetical protein